MEGIRIENCNLPVPSKSRVALPTEAIHYDEAIYPHPLIYNPFRFAHRQDPHPDRRFEGIEAKTDRSTVTLDHDFLSFGVPGRWACPGRFFALLELKIFVAHLLLNYDVAFMAERPKPIYLVWARYPPDAMIKMRRRKVKGSGVGAAAQ